MLVNTDELFEEIKLALVNEWQHLNLKEKESEDVYNMIVETLANFKKDRLCDFTEKT